MQYRRLNHNMLCPGCKTVVNPFVVEERQQTIYLECPTCGETRNFSIAKWVVK